MNTKLGAHVLAGSREALDLVRAGSKLIKTVDAFGVGWEAQQITPDVLVVGRAFVGYDPVEDYVQTGILPYPAARKFVYGDQLRQVERYEANSHISIWEGANEPLCDTLDKMKWYAEFESARVELMADMGLRCVIGNFSTGQPRLDLPVWSEFLPAIRVAMQHGGYLGLHEYSWPTMWWMVGDNQVATGSDAREPRGSDEGWTTLRYRKVYREYLLPVGLPIPLIITECGIDGGVNPKPFYGKTGAFNHPELRQVWRDRYGKGNPDEFYAENLLWYDRELKKDGYVIGATIFTFGSYGGPWAEFDINGSRVVEYIAQELEADMPDEYPQIEGGWWGKVKVPPHGTPAPVRKSPNDSGEVLWTMYESSAWWYVSKVHWEVSDWWYYIEPNETGWGEAGWIKNKKPPDHLDKYGNLPEIAPSPPLPSPPEPSSVVVQPLPIATSQLNNPSFEGGHYRAPHPISGNTPEGWELLWWANVQTPRLDADKPRGQGLQDAPFYEPEINPIKYYQMAEGRELVKDGDTSLKLFKGSAPMWAIVGQKVNLTPGRWRFSIWVYPDQVMGWEGGKKVYPSPASSPDWYLGSETRLRAKSETWFNTMEFQDARQVPYGTWTQLRLMFDVAEAGEVTVALECRGRWGFGNNGFFIDATTLERLGELEPGEPDKPVEPEPDEPEPTPPPFDEDVRGDILRELAVIEASVEIIRSLLV